MSNFCERGQELKIEYTESCATELNHRSSLRPLMLLIARFQQQLAFYSFPGRLLVYKE